MLERPSPAVSLPSPPAPSPPLLSKRLPSFWERTKQSTVGVLDNAYKLTLTSRKTSQSSIHSTFEGFYPTSLEVESIRAARILRSFTLDANEFDPLASPETGEREVGTGDEERVKKKIPPELVQTTKGLVVLTVFRTGSLFSTVNGSGIVLARLPDGSWSSPSGVLLKTIGFAFSAGVDVYDIVLLLRNERAVESFFHSAVSLGQDISIAPGPVGSAMLLEDEAEVASIWSYTKSKSLYEGIKLNGTMLSERMDENTRTYGRVISAEEILNGAARPEYWVGGLHETILAAEGLEFRPELIPSGPSPSDSFPLPSSPPSLAHSPLLLETPLSPPLSPPISPDPSIMSNLSRSSNRRLPKEELSEEDLAVKRELEETLKAFGIDDVGGNERERKEDPLLVVEEQRDEVEDDSFEFGEDEAENGLGLTEVRSRENSTTSGRNSLELKVGVTDPERVGTPAKDHAREEESKSEETKPEISIATPIGTPSKPPVPPRRTPRIPPPSTSTFEEEEKLADQGEEKENASAVEKSKEVSDGESAVEIQEEVVEVDGVAK